MVGFLMGQIERKKKASFSMNAVVLASILARYLFIFEPSPTKDLLCTLHLTQRLACQFQFRLPILAPQPQPQPGNPIS